MKKIMKIYDYYENKKHGTDEFPLQYYYVDKTMMIRDFIDERPMVTLFTRPRRFGKTLNMDMLRTYF